jgi:signal peptidase
MKENETKTQNKGASRVVKTIINTVINIMIVLVLIVSIVIAVMALSSKANGGISVIFGHTVEIVQTDSMKGGSPDYPGGDFEKGDVIIGKFMDNSMFNDGKYSEGDIVTYKGDLDGDPETKEYICHRIIEEVDYNGNKSYRTKGDNGELSDQAKGDYASYITAGDISSVFYSKDYQGKILKGFGTVLSFLQSKFGFFICILVPMIIFFLYELIRVIFNFAYYRKAKEEEGAEAAESEKQAAIDAAVAEALAKNKSQQEDLNPENMTPEQMEQFKQFLAQQKEQDKHEE